MQSFTTQSHQRNYQGHIIFHDQKQTTHHQKQHHKILTGIVITVMALTTVITSSLLGIMTQQNQQLVQQVQTLQAQTASTHTISTQNTTPSSGEHKFKRHGKALRRVPISNRKHETHPIPSIENDDENRDNDFQVRAND